MPFPRRMNIHKYNVDFKAKYNKLFIMKIMGRSPGDDRWWPRGWHGLKTAVLLVFSLVLGVWCGHRWGVGVRGLALAVIFIGAVELAAVLSGWRLVFRMHRAQPLAEAEAPEVYAIVRRLSQKAGIFPPSIYLLPSASANLFTVSRGLGASSIALTYGLVGLLNEEEIAGVLGHEFSHILYGDHFFGTIVAAGVSVLSLSASFFNLSFAWGGERDERDRENPLPLLLSAVVLPFAAGVIRLAMPRNREYVADRCGAQLCGSPLYLASALRKIDSAIRRFPLRDAAFSTAHLFIVNPLSNKGWGALFNAHPLIEKRIARLEGLPPKDQSLFWGGVESIDDGEWSG